MQTKCSCSKRDCVKKSSSCGEMCVGITHTTLSLGLEADTDSEEYKRYMKRLERDMKPRLPVFVEKGLEELFKERENQLTPEMNKLILDNLSDLYEE